MATTVLAQTPTLNLPMPLTGLWRHATHATHVFVRASARTIAP